MIDVKNQVIRNCHVKGIHSVVMSEYKGRLTRMFIADQDHEMYDTGDLAAPALAYHPHKRDITILCLYGYITNTIIEFKDEGRLRLEQFVFDSAIMGTGGRRDGSFQRTRKVFGFEVVRSTSMVSDGQVHMKASEIHSVSVRQGCPAAWIVIEGDEDPLYHPFAYSARDLHEADISDLYHKA